MLIEFRKKNISVHLRSVPLAGVGVPIFVPALYSKQEIRLADALNIRAIRADAVESITCEWLALVVIAALEVQLATGLWWIDPVASLAIVWVLVREGNEA